jgi:predicted AlkP superfamily pyrophosphatase or phosphodiesterase
MKPSLKLNLALIILQVFICSGPLRASQPDLVLMIVVDQLRGDMPLRSRDRFSPGGFRYLMDHGMVYTNAHFSHMVTTTAAGHATLATGGNPPQHGIASNEWFDVKARRPEYNTADPRYQLISAPPKSGQGRSPRNLTSTTFGDEMVTASAGNARVFSVSIKDRAAIILGGHLGKAYWYSKKTGGFTTSTYYHDELPGWLQRWNEGHHADAFRNQDWDLLQERQRYTFREQDDRWFEKPEGRLGRTFPHPLQNDDNAAYYSTLRYTPMGDELTLDLLKALVNAENIGNKGYTDMLAVSFSVTDYIGHAFGPNSLEAEDNLLRLDRTLQELLKFIDDKIGLANTLVVLSADHGISPAPEYMQALGFEAGRHNVPELMKQVNSALQEKFHTERMLALAYQTPGIYLDPDAADSLGLTIEEVERAVATEVMKASGYYLALTKSDLMSGRIPATQAAQLVSNSLHPVRSGNVILVQDPFWYLASTPDEDAAMHGSPYNYDNHIPIMIAGPGIGHGSINRRVAPRDIAPTISDYLGIAPPSGSVGTPLPRH